MEWRLYFSMWYHDKTTYGEVLCLFTTAEIFNKRRQKNKQNDIIDLP